MTPRIHDKAGAAKFLGVPPSRVDYLRKTGQLKFVDLSRNPGSQRPRIRFLEEHLLEFLDSRTCNGAPARKKRRRKSDDRIVKFY